MSCLLHIGKTHTQPSPSQHAAYSITLWSSSDAHVIIVGTVGGHLSTQTHHSTVTQFQIKLLKHLTELVNSKNASMFSFSCCSADVEKIFYASKTASGPKALGKPLSMTPTRRPVRQLHSTPANWFHVSLLVWDKDLYGLTSSHRQTTVGLDSVSIIVLLICEVEVMGFLL